MKQKCSNGRSVPSTHTHTHTHRNAGFQRSFLVIMMLFALMMKPDVGWGQGCNELLGNHGLTINSGVTDGEEAYCDGDVASWFGVDWTAHILQQDQNSNTTCNFNITNRNNTITCLRADGIGNFRESIAQGGLNITNDSYVTYNLAISTKMLNCDPNNNFTSANLDVYLNNEENFLGSCWKQNVGWSPIGAEFVGLTTINSFNLQTINFSFNPINSYDALWIRSWRPINGNMLPYSVLGIEDVSLTCTTTALTDILVSNTSGLNYNFTGVNSSTVSTFTDYSWTITNSSGVQIVNSLNADFDFTFSSPGTYTVCLDIIDTNGCCGSLCETVVVDCDIPTANFTLQGTCPNFSFVPSILDESYSYTWLVNGTVVGTNGVQTYTFTENGTYTIMLEVMDACGNPAKFSYTITIDCICDAPMANFNFAINCVNKQGVTTFTVLNGQLGDSYAWNFGDGTTATTTAPSIVHNYATSQTFTVSLTVTNVCGETQIITKPVTVSCEQYCPQNDGRTQYTINGANGGVTFSQALISLGVPINTGNINPFVNLNFVLVGDVTLDISAYFDNCKFIAMAGAQLILSPSAIGTFNKGSSQFIGCEFFGCTNMWKGIRDEGASASFYGGTIEDALYGIHAANSGSLIITGVGFSHNFIGVYLTSNASHAFAGNQFTGGTLKPKYNGYPSFADKNFAGIYAQGFTLNGDGSYNFGCSYLTVGDNGGSPNTFSNLQNGIIQAGGFSTNIKNNIFSDLQGISTLSSTTNISLNSNVQGVGILIRGSGWFGMNIEKNVMTNGEYGVAILNASLSSPVIKNYNQFTNFKNGLYVTGLGSFGSKIYVTDHNSFNCRVNGIYFDENYGPSFECKNNTFYQSSGIVLDDGSNGLKVTSLSGGTLGNFGQGLISGNNFYISTPEHSNGMIDISQYGSVSVVGQNKLHFMSPSLLVSSGHGGLRLNNVSFAEVTENEFYNYTGSTFSGRNSLFNVAKSAVCCNQTYGLHHGFSFGGTGTGRSTYSQNMMSGDFNGINIGQGVKLGEQVNLGNTWLGASRVANLESGASGGNNRFYANPNQNTQNKWFWPTQTPSVWFVARTEIASEICNLNQCSMPLANISGDTPPTAEAIQVLEDMLDDGHIMIADYVAPGRWAKERWLYGYLTAHPYLLTYSEVLSTFYTDAAEDVKQYEDFYQEIADRIALPPAEVESLNAQKEQAQSLMALHETKWAAYQASNSQALYEELEAIRAQQGNMIPTAYQLMESHRNGMQEYWEEMKAVAQSLPETQPYTQVAKTYANIYIDQMLYGDDYISTHHTATLQYIAGLCESMYKETVVLARNMLAHLGDNTQYDDQDICAKSLENRAKAAPSTITITPNPTTGKVTVSNAGDIQAIEIRSAGGTLLRSVAGNQHSIDVTDLANGIYFITILQKNGVQVTKKLIKIN